MDHSPFELVERTVSQPWADDMPTKVEYRSFSPCACKAGEMVVSLRPIDDTRHVYVSGLGPYEIAEYVSKDDQKTYYHVWVDGKDTNESMYTLEQAMVLAVAVKTMGQHPRGLDTIFRALVIDGK